jgi:hypothetical protein
MTKHLVYGCTKQMHEARLQTLGNDNIVSNGLIYRLVGQSCMLLYVFYRAIPLFDYVGYNPSSN